MNKKKLFIILLGLAVLSCGPFAVTAKGQYQDGETAKERAKNPGKARIALSTNITDYVYLVTPNLDAQVSVARFLTVQAGVKYNGWSFKAGTPDEMKNRQWTAYVGARWWPWYTYSGWWVGSAMQYQEYDRGGLFYNYGESGDAYGLVLSGGYSMQIRPWLNFDFGISGWGGYTRYKKYACAYCGKLVEEGGKGFFLPNEVRVALMFIF